MTDTLQRVRDGQFADKPAAEALLLAFIQTNFPELRAVSVELTPKPTSLNSFNGFLVQADGSKRFFKTHTESHTIINEYYNAELLAQANYPIIQPIFRSTEPGKQFLVYELITDAAVFDLARQLELQPDPDLQAALTRAQHAEDEALYQRYLATLAWQTHDEAPIHQLFQHRLVGGRLEQFYGASVQITLPQGRLPMATVRRQKWVINGQVYTATLDDLIEQATQVLAPMTAGAAIIGHGDAHNGNVFYRAGAQKLIYFDPAFAGKHSPLLDLVKPLYHNVYAMWMYFPHEERQKLHLTLTEQGDTWHIAHNYTLNPIRELFLRSKWERVLLPSLQTLQQKGWLPKNWRDLLKAALFCCPFLTMNLADGQRFPPEIALLGLAHALEMGAESGGQRSVLDALLDEAHALLR
jgi:hypothetical protein